MKMNGKLMSVEHVNNSFVFFFIFLFFLIFFSFLILFFQPTFFLISPSLSPLRALIDSIRFLGLRIKRKVSFSPVLLDSLLERCLEHGYLAGAVTLLVARHSGVDRFVF